jgi:hypothetical protein
MRLMVTKRYRQKHALQAKRYIYAQKAIQIVTIKVICTYTVHLKSNETKILKKSESSETVNWK